MFVEVTVYAYIMYFDSAFKSFQEYVTEVLSYEY